MTVTKQADDKNRLQAVLDELADAAGFVERPHLVIDPISARWSGTTAAANADLNVVRVSPELAQEDIATVRCVLAHELGHLWHRHGKGAIAWSFLYAIGAGIAGIVGWMMWDLRTGAAFFGIAMVARYFRQSMQRETYRENWTNDPREREADAFAERLVGKEAFDAYRCGHRRLKGITSPDLTAS
uniref:Membrane protein n=1 Tax=Magnetospirillum gryphiswaldense TaxID=55518 RepID=A0A9P1JCS4_9PROT|nr:M48 family metalloprotease [Magnetospirillum gryphiswaldense]CAM78236.1 membrane protein [Magnetospirillum gryphiswaldense MSR-1]